jgi:hypothetical protein
MGLHFGRFFSQTRLVTMIPEVRTPVIIITYIDRTTSSKEDNIAKVHLNQLQLTFK